MKKLAVVLMMSSLAFGASAHAAGDAKAGLEKSAACTACHGQDGNSISSQFPNLAGQYADYLYYALKQYQTGARQNAIMAGFVAGLSDEDMRDLAAYYASQQGLAILPR